MCAYRRQVLCSDKVEHILRDLGGLRDKRYKKRAFLFEAIKDFFFYKHKQ